MDFSVLPPEINSGRMYSGPGSGPLMAAATAWDELATELGSTADSYSSVISGLTGAEWLGPSSASMAAAAAPYMAWMSTTAAQAEQSAAQAMAAASAYEAAFAMTVPPPVIAANRSLTMMLIATNILGQNTAAIAANEAQYAEMWAQDSDRNARLCRRFGGIDDVEPVHFAAADHQPGRARGPGRPRSPKLPRLPRPQQSHPQQQ